MADPGLVARILVETIRGLDLQWPEVSEAEHKANAEARRQLEAEAEPLRSPKHKVRVAVARGRAVSG